MDGLINRRAFSKPKPNSRHTGNEFDVGRDIAAANGLFCEGVDVDLESFIPVVDQRRLEKVYGCRMRIHVPGMWMRMLT